MYLDPGFGGMMVQVFFVLIAVGGAVIFTFRKKIKALFTKKDSKSDKQKGAAKPSAEAYGEEDDFVDSMSKKK